MVVELTMESIVVFLVFIILVFILYKIFKFIVRASLVSIAGFAFPWVARYMGIPIATNIETGITFAFIGLGLFFIYEFYRFIVQFFRMLAWPFKKKKKK
jgi:lipoprotein signal peptidase